MRLAILGATGAVGRTMLRVLDERRFPVDELVPLASARSVGQAVSWRGREWPVREPGAGVFEGCSVALFSAGAARSRTWGPVAAQEGAVVVDNSSAWRMDDGVPLVVPEVNPAAIATRPRGIIANPNCAAIPLAVSLHTLRQTAPLRRVLVTTFQSVSGAGQRGLDAMRAEQAGASYEASPFRTRIAGNVIPFIGARADSGWNEEELKIRNETRKILDLPDLPVAATCVRVPVAVGHSLAVAVELQRPLPLDEALDAFEGVAGLALHRGDDDPTPLAVAGTDAVRVGHVRMDPDDARIVHFWVVADNLRKGAATNAVQIAEQVCRG